MTESLTCDTIIEKFSSDFDSMVNTDYMKNLNKINSKEFKIWISQEYFFLQELMRNFAICLYKSPSINGLKTFSRGISFLRHNMDILESKMNEYNIPLDEVNIKDETMNYVQFIRSIRESDYSQQVLVNWLVCYVYNQVIERNQMPNIASDMLNLWKDIEFCEFLENLKNEVDRNISQGKNIETNLNDIMKNLKNLELDSWKMLTKS